MKKTVLIIATLVAAGITSANAQLLWRVSGKDAKGDSYLFGTHHIAPASVMDSVKGFAPALASVEEVYGEVELPENPQSPEVMQLTMKCHGSGRFDPYESPDRCPGRFAQLAACVIHRRYAQCGTARRFQAFDGIDAACHVAECQSVSKLQPYGAA